MYFIIQCLSCPKTLDAGVTSGFLPLRITSCNSPFGLSFGHSILLPAKLVALRAALRAFKSDPFGFVAGMPFDRLRTNGILIIQDQSKNTEKLLR
jgi:hypothetical protein